MSLPGFPSVTPFILRRGEKGGCFSICLYLALPLSLHSSYRKVKKPHDFNICLYLASSLSFIFWQGEKGGGLNVCLYLGFPSVTPFVFWQGEKGGGLNVCLYLAFPLSLHSSHGKVRRGGVLTYVSTWPCSCHSIHLMAR